MQRFRFYNIKWDTDGVNPEELNLPSEHTCAVADKNFDPENEGADLLSDKFGFCVFGFDFQQFPN